ncbi:MAG TPA: DUF4198 domain-containing protein [bacterium]|nr:DUF4198 domain-containing protein [bacterium]HOL46900.1 DUF4198 domain-containing protein [bacterium]HPQ18338.1 DUF4198 domain-containing protein [bacterium]
MFLKLFILFIFTLQLSLSAHFQMIIPSANIISQKDNKTINLDIRFTHPMEMKMMNMAKPEKFAVKIKEKEIDLTNDIKPVKIDECQAYNYSYKITEPGNYIFYIIPAPYWEPDEEIYIIHYAKTYVNAFGLEEGWDTIVGLKTEILPLTRPYGLWTGNIFSGQVYFNGEPYPNALIEVEYFNKDKKIKVPADPYITQTLITDENGIFHYAIPKAGWWGFAALIEDDKKMTSPDGKEVNVETGGIIWIYVIDMK